MVSVGKGVGGVTLGCEGVEVQRNSKFWKGREREWQDCKEAVSREQSVLDCSKQIKWHAYMNTILMHLRRSLL